VYTVFNAQQIEGIPPHTPEQHTTFEAVQAGEQILKNSGANIAHDQADRAFYSRSQDSIHLPPKDAFMDAAGYYGTAPHELAHWTGHPSRLDRSTLTDSYRFGDVNYAKEELRAELASVFLAAQRGIPHNPEQHAAYVNSWIGALKRDKNEIFRAAHDGSKATDFILALERDKSIGEEDLVSGPVRTSSRSWENANRISGGVAASSNGTLRLSENITSYSAGEDAANSRYAAATDSTVFPRLTRFRAFSKARPISWKPSIATAREMFCVKTVFTPSVIDERY
jgi:hypothetical protein